MAERVYVSTDKYLSWEKGEAVPDLETAAKLADVFGVSLDTLTNAVYTPKLQMGIDDGISEKERKAILAERENAEIDRYNRGRLLMKIIIAIEAVMLALSFFTTNLLASIFRIIMLVCLWRGHSWARYVYVILTAIGALITFALTGQLFEMSIILGIIAIAETLYGVVVCVLLIANKSVEEFLYEQKTSH